VVVGGIGDNAEDGGFGVERLSGVFELFGRVTGNGGAVRTPSRDDVSEAVRSPVDESDEVAIGLTRLEGQREGLVSGHPGKEVTLDKCG
jgi:hypothetical protein